MIKVKQSTFTATGYHKSNVADRIKCPSFSGDKRHENTRKFKLDPSFSPAFHAEDRRRAEGHTCMVDLAKTKTHTSSGFFCS